VFESAEQVFESAEPALKVQKKTAIL